MSTEAPVEAVAVAQLLDVRPDQLTGIKLIPGDKLHSAPNPDGFTRTEGLIEFSTRSRTEEKFLIRYDTPHGPGLVVDHEDGPEIFTVLAYAKEVSEFLGSIAGLITFANSIRKPWGPAKGKKIRWRRYKPNGKVNHDAEGKLDEHAPIREQLQEDLAAD
jgi:hypothetical protein